MTNDHRIDGEVVPQEPDLARMRHARRTKLQSQLDTQGLDGLVLLSTSAVEYATGISSPGLDGDQAALTRSVAVVINGDPTPHLYTAFLDGVPTDYPHDHVHPPLFPTLAGGAARLGRVLAEYFSSDAALAIDEQTHEMLGSPGDHKWSDASAPLAAAKLTKTADELTCIRQAQRISELAMVDVREQLRPGVRQIDLSAIFLKRVFELGATARCIDPIWQVMTPTRAAGPWTVHGDLAYPTVTTDRFLREGDIIWVDAGVAWHGYASDYGRTWITSSDPTPSDHQIDQFQRWRAVVDAALDILKPGVSAQQLADAAIESNGGVRPWIDHFYLAHGLGTDSAEMPLIGTDLGTEFDEQQIMAPGMVLVFEPVIWDDGSSGYRAEDIVAVTDDGWMKLSGSTYDPFEVPA